MKYYEEYLHSSSKQTSSLCLFYALVDSFPLSTTPMCLHRLFIALQSTPFSLPCARSDSHTLSSAVQGLQGSHSLSCSLIYSSALSLRLSLTSPIFPSIFSYILSLKFSELFSTFSPFYLKLTENNSTHHT